MRNEDEGYAEFKMREAEAHETEMEAAAGAEGEAMVEAEEQSVTDPAREEFYPCDRCGKLRTKAEGGTTFTVCEKCWEETMGETMTETDPVREEMEEVIYNWDSDCNEEKSVDWGTAIRVLCTDLLRVIRGHTEKSICFEEEDNRLAYSTDKALTHTLESLPEK